MNIANVKKITVLNYPKFIFMLLSFLGAYYTLRSAYFGYVLARPIPFHDQWNFVEDYIKYVDNKYEFINLFSLHNEHRFFVTRVFMFVDAIYFNMNNKFLIFSIFSAYALIISLFTYCLDRKYYSYLNLPILSGLLLSICQWQNLSWGIQVCFVFVHAFTFLCLISLAKISSSEASFSFRNYWFLLALFSDFICIYSLASGMLVIFPVIAQGIWTRKIRKETVYFCLFHVFLCVLYFYHYTPPAHHSWAIVSPKVYIEYFLTFIGSNYRVFNEMPVIIGALLFFCGAIYLVLFTTRSVIYRHPNNANSSALLGMALFVFLEAGAASLGRASFGVDQALSSRYTTPAIILITSLLVLIYNNSYSLQSSLGKFTRLFALLLGAMSIIVSNSNFYLSEWSEAIRSRDMVGRALANGVNSDVINRSLYPFPDYVTNMIPRMNNLGLGPFSIDANPYKPPLNYLAQTDFDKFPLCKYNIDKIDELETNTGGLRVYGWAFDGVSFQEPESLMAFNLNGSYIGFTNFDIPREDLLSSFQKNFHGFDIAITKKNLTGSPKQIVFIAILPKSEMNILACKFVVDF